MADKTVPNEKAMIDAILHRKTVRDKRIPAEQMQLFKAKVGDEIQRSGRLRQEFVDRLLQQLKSGEL